MDDIFISEDVGAEKPSPFFFEKVLSSLGSAGGEEVLIVGDSLTSDVLGGKNAGIKTCLFSPGPPPARPDPVPDYVVRRLDEVLKIVSG